MLCSLLTAPAMAASGDLLPITSPASLTVAANSGPTGVGLAAPTDPKHPKSVLSVEIIELPKNGAMYLRGGTARVSLRQKLTVQQLTGLEFAPSPGVSAQTGHFIYSVTNRAGGTTTGVVQLFVNENVGHILTVGPGQQYSTIAAAIGASRNGDTILVQAGTYTNDFAIINTDITLQGLGGMVNMVATEPIPNGKAIFVTNGDDTINNFSFSGAKVANQNGAGIRYQAGHLMLNDDYFHDNEEGLLSAASATGTITINDSEFEHNGSGDGLTHNLYAGDIATLTINNSYFHDAVVGHEIKSRARATLITNSRIFDGPTGTASYSIDLPNGGKALIKDNVIEQGPLSDNPIVITSGEEAGIYPNTSLQVIGNKILNDLSSPSALAIRNATPAVAAIIGNQFYGLMPNQIASGLHKLSNNRFLSTQPKLVTSHPWSP